MFVTEGAIEGGGLLAVLRSVAGCEKSGLLAVQGDQDLVSIAFIDGKIVAVDAMNRPMEEALSEVLASRGLVAPQRFAVTVDPILGTGRLAGDVLLEAELVEREELLDAVREQVCEQALQLLRWEQGLFSWTPGAESPYQKGMQPLTVAELLVRSAEEQGVGSAFGHAGVELGEHFSKNVAGPPLIFGKDGEWIEEGDERVWLTPVENQVLDSIDAAQPASHLLLGIGVESFELRYALQVLLQVELIRRVTGSDSKVEAEVGQVRGLLGSEGDISDLLSSPSVELSLGDDLPAAEFPERVGEKEARSESEAREVSDLDLDASLLDQVDWEQPEPFGDGLEESFVEPLGANFRSDPDGAGRVAQRPETVARVLSIWAARGMALGFVCLLLAQVLFKARRHDLKFPFFWQVQAAEALESKFWDATAAKIESALRVYHLLYGRFPDDLEILVDLQLLAPSTLYDSRGRWLAYSTDGDGYSLRPAEGELTLDALRRTGGVANDLFLDPKFVSVAQPDEPAVRVID